MSLIFSIGGSSKGIMTPLETKAVYPVGTVIDMYVYGMGTKRYVVVGETMGTYGHGQDCIAEDLSSKSDVNRTHERANGGIGIGSFDVVEDLIYTPAQVAYLKQAYADKVNAEWEQKKQAEREKEEERKRLVAIGLPIVEASKPKNAAAVIIARLMEDDSDYASDYHNSKLVKVVILAYSTHTRDLFDEMRSAALNFEETKFFATDEDCKKYENREKYSMGKGYYLGTGRNSGWQIKKVPVSSYSDERLAELAGNPDTWKVPVRGSQASGEAVDIQTADVTIVENKEKQGIEIYFASKPSADVIAKIKAHGWRWAKYNKCWYKKASPAAMEFAKQFVNQ